MSAWKTPKSPKWTGRRLCLPIVSHSQHRRCGTDSDVGAAPRAVLRQRHFAVVEQRQLQPDVVAIRDRDLQPGSVDHRLRGAHLGERVLRDVIASLDSHADTWAICRRTACCPWTAAICSSAPRATSASSTRSPTPSATPSPSSTASSSSPSKAVSTAASWLFFFS